MPKRNRMKIALTIPTGRPRVKEVVKAFLNNAKEHGFNLKDFSVYLAIDTNFTKSKISDFYLDNETTNEIKKVKYITKKIRSNLSEKLIKNKISKTASKVLFSGNGYSKQRNAALFFAAKDNNDFAICFDDDENPNIPIKNSKGEIKWKNLDFFGPHIKALKNGTDITRGPIMGYQSPIPSDFEKDIPQEIRKKLGEALKLGNEVINENSFFNMLNDINYLSEKKLNSSYWPFKVKETSLGKHIFAGNMGINLTSVREGKIPVFYTPPSARGEDTIFSLQLEKIEVKEVKSFIFHDPFNVYPRIFKNIFPKSLKPIPLNKSSKERFSNALIGWLKYAPILVNMTEKNEKKTKLRLSEMSTKIKEVTKELSEFIKCEKLNSSYEVLKKYIENVEVHHTELNELQEEWFNKIVPQINLEIENEI